MYLRLQDGPLNSSGWMSMKAGQDAEAGGMFGSAVKMACFSGHPQFLSFPSGLFESDNNEDYVRLFDYVATDVRTCRVWRQHSH